MSLSDTDTNTPINTMGDGEHLPGRSLHVCATPWRPGQRTAPVQLREGPTQVYHRSILAILNRITDAKIDQLVERATLVLITGNVTEHDPSQSAAPVMTPAPSDVVNVVRKDFISMLLEKAQDEELYAREYSLFLLRLCKCVLRTEHKQRDKEGATTLSSLHCILNAEFLRRFHHLFNQLRSMYNGLSTWNDELERQLRRQIVTHLQLGVELHLYCELLPLATLLLVRDLMAQPLHVPHLQALNTQLPAVCAELVARFLLLMAHLNIQDLGGSALLCDILQQQLPQLCSRRVFHVLATLQLHTDNWRQPNTPSRSRA